MPLRFFTIPARDDGSAERELNGLLQSRRVLSVERHWVEDGANSFWAECVDYLDSAPQGGRSGKEKIDYKQVLTPGQFELFAKLRDWRKQVAQEDAVPVYVIFTNEQLAEIVRRRAMTKAALQSIEGVGGARIDKYGDRLLAMLNHEKDAANETGKSAVQPDS